MAVQIKTWGATYYPKEADREAQKAFAMNDRRLAHDILWDASNNGWGHNGWSIPDRWALNEVVNGWSRPAKELSYSAINQEFEKTGRPLMTCFENRVTRVTAEVRVLASKPPSIAFLFDEEVETGCTITETSDQKLSMSITAGFAGIEATVSVKQRLFALHFKSH
jgi:hypothetical protein